LLLLLFSLLLLLLLLLLQVGVGYKLPSGKVLTSSMPATIEELESVEVVYETLPGWQSDISGARKWSDLPAAAQVC
jgi:adenylosuccinate synthase